MSLGMSQPEADGEFWRGVDEGEKIRESGTTHWNSPNLATNSSGFTALPAGYRSADDGEFYFIGDWAYFWTSTSYDAENAWYRNLTNTEGGVFRYRYLRRSGRSVRCLKD